MSRTVIDQYKDSEPLSLPAETLQFLISNYGNRLDIRPAGGGAVVLRGTNYVGLIRAPHLDVVVKPKIGSLSVYWMLGFADRLVKFDPDDFPFDEESGLLDVLARLFARQTELILRRGIYRTYVERVENLNFVRGRILLLDDIRANRGLRHQVVCRFAELTPDVMHNQILRAVSAHLLRYDFRLEGVRRMLAWNQAHLTDVSLVPIGTRDFRQLTYDRLNGHYRGVMALAELIMRHLTFEFDIGSRSAPSFLVNMDAIYQEFLTQLVREALAGSPLRIRSSGGLHLDQGRDVPIDPDIVITDGRRPIVAIDAKYKRVDTQADVYQALAYAKGLGLARVALVYPADGDVAPATHLIKNDDIEVLVRTVPVGSRGLGLVELEQQARLSVRGLLLELAGSSMAAVAA